MSLLEFQKGDRQVNRRQKKKQFKKVYGMNPKQYEKYLQEHWHEICVEVAKIAYEGIKKGFERTIITVVEAAEVVRSTISELAEEIRVAARTIEAYEEKKENGENGKGINLASKN